MMRPLVERYLVRRRAMKFLICLSTEVSVRGFHGPSKDAVMRKGERKRGKVSEHCTAS